MARTLRKWSRMSGTERRIIVAETRRDILGEAVAEAVRRSPGLRMLEPAPLADDRLEAMLASLAEGPPVLVLVGERERLEARCATLARRHPDLTIVCVAIGDDTLRLDAPRLGIEGLVAVLRSLASPGPAGHPEPVKRYTLASEQAPARPVLHDPWRTVRDWIDAVLRLGIVRTTERGVNDLPGLGLTSQAALDLLARRGAEHAADEPSLAGLRAAVDRAARDLHAVLRDRVGHRERLGRLVDRLGLQPLEVEALLLVLAPELDPVYQRLFSFLEDDLGRRVATLGLVCALLGDPPEVRRALAEKGGLVRWRLLAGGGEVAPGADQPLRADPVLAGWLLDGQDLATSDPALERILGLASRPAPPTGPDDERLRDALRAAVADDGVWLVFVGGSAQDRRAAVEAAAAAGGVRLLHVAPDPGLALAPGEAEAAAVRLARASRVTRRLPVLELADIPPEASAREVVERAVWQLLEAGRAGVILAAARADTSVLPAGTPYRLLGWRPAPAGERAAGLLASAARHGCSFAAHEAERIARQFALPPRALDAACALARATAAGQGCGEAPGAAEVRAACRALAMPGLPRYARRVEPAFGLADVVLPADRHRQLAAIVAQLRHADTVLDRWGFGARLPYGRGVAALFSGPSGTGKTMAAQAIARALETDLFHVDLARIVSKYIGETEKHLDAVFSEAERAGVVLLFDEADALFGKRGEVKDAHDRYANIETAYLLQRMEAFSGLAILTTNLGQNVDAAFQRRLAFQVAFPRPDAAAREAIWRWCLPEGAPLAGDIDLRFLARRLELTGGNIRQITLRAAYAAAAAGAPIGMRHLVEATRAELLKLGLPGAERELAERAAA
jgi:hypothetical protein